MKKIKNVELINPFDGKPIQVTYDFQKDVEGKAKKDEFGNPIPLQKPMTTALGIRTFISNGFDPKETTLEDGYSAMKILDVIRPFKLLEEALGFTQPKCILLEDAEYKFLLQKMKDRGPKIWGIIAPVYVSAVEDLEKIETPGEFSESGDAPANGARPKQLVKSGKP